MTPCCSSASPRRWAAAADHRVCAERQRVRRRHRPRARVRPADRPGGQRMAHARRSAGPALLPQRPATLCVAPWAGLAQRAFLTAQALAIEELAAVGLLQCVTDAEGFDAALAELVEASPSSRRWRRSRPSSRSTNSRPGATTNRACARANFVPPEALTLPRGGRHSRKAATAVHW